MNDTTNHNPPTKENHMTITNYVVTQDTDGFFYSFIYGGINDRRVSDDGFDTMREAAHDLINLIDTGFTPGGNITLSRKAKLTAFLGTAEATTDLPMAA